MLSDGDYDELHETIARHGWRIKAIQRLQPRAKRPASASWALSIVNHLKP
jgi:hypothetical protein